LDKPGVPLRPGLKNNIGTSSYHLDKSSMAKHSLILGHHIQLCDINILAKKSTCMEHIISPILTA